MTRHEFKLQTPRIYTSRLYDYFASTIFLRPLLVIKYFLCFIVCVFLKKYNLLPKIKFTSPRINYCQLYKKEF